MEKPTSLLNSIEAPNIEQENNGPTSPKNTESPKNHSNPTSPEVDAIVTNEDVVAETVQSPIEKEEKSNEVSPENVETEQGESQILDIPKNDETEKPQIENSDTSEVMINRSIENLSETVILDSNVNLETTILEPNMNLETTISKPDVNLETQSDISSKNEIDVEKPASEIIKEPISEAVETKSTLTENQSGAEEEKVTIENENTIIDEATTVNTNEKHLESNEDAEEIIENIATSTESKDESKNCKYSSKEDENINSLDDPNNCDNLNEDVNDKSSGDLNDNINLIDDEKDKPSEELSENGNLDDSEKDKSLGEPNDNDNLIEDEKDKSSTEQNDDSNLIANEKDKSFYMQTDKENVCEETEKKDDEQMEQNSEYENEENPIFVHVNTEREDDGKGDKTSEQVQEDEDFQNSQPQEDPIAADEDPKDNIEDSEQGADAELCIIPDTERVISQEEKDAASALLPAADAILQTTESSTVIDSEEKFVITKSTDESLHSCIQCLLPRKSKYISTTDQRTLYICSDNCLNSFKEDHPGKIISNRIGDLRVKNLTSENSTPSTTPVSTGVFVRKCAECMRTVAGNDESNLSWETMDFCNELCLSKYQKTIASNCSYCTGDVRPSCLGKYAVRFGYDIRQFCSSHCLEEYKKGLKVCSYCQKDISAGTEGFLAPAGDKGQFKDFCSPFCMDKYNNMSQHKKPVLKPGILCSVCLNETAISIEYEHDGKMNLFCGEPCFVAFKFVNHIDPGKCDMCGRYFDFRVLEKHTIFYDDKQHSFCSKSCQNIYIIGNRRIVPCSWCKVKKYNFDMIKRYSSSGQPLVMCSLNCLNLHQVSLNALSLKKTQCDHCMKSSQPMYHLTMSDATTRNFCSYNCVMTFQNQFSKKPLTLNEPEGSPVPTGAPKRSRRTLQKESDLPALPVISNVQSLAPITNGASAPTSARTTRSKANASTTPMPSTPTVTTQIKHHVIVKPRSLPEVKNMMTMCKPVVINKSVNTEVNANDKECQTEDMHKYPPVIPIPVPIYVPVPLPLMVAPYPSPTPFPLPVPVPIFIPTTRNSANGILKEIKKIQVKIPTDPYEAELLMMAEMVAGDKKEEHTDSESEDEDTTAAQDDTTFSPEPVDASNSFGDDMLQMALKMASELDEPAVDLEGALTANTITAPQGSESGANEENVDDPQPISQIISRQSFKGKKRAAKSSKGNASKRGRRSSQAADVQTIPQQQQTQVPSEPVEKPDANMCLKYTFGVNAWKQWVTTKNAELEKSSRRVKLFKPEILQLTADELNYSLCLFVKEVRKPNGAEYAPDTIYYLCLGIQQYLFENGRIDNIFCDAYYEKFTDCLDEVARKFSVLYNDSHYIVTRVEEEHLWESKQLGAHSPHVLLSTLMFFNTKHFNLTTVDEHMQLSFSHIMKHWKRNPNQPGSAKTPGSRNVLLRFYPPQTAIANNRKKKVYEQQENEENPLRCPVKLYEFYLSKCPESVKTRNDVFYLLPERSCVPDSPVWYSTMPLPREALEKMLHRVKMVKEINVALLTS